MLNPLALVTVLCAAAPASPTFSPKNRPYDVSSYRIELKLKDADTFDNKAIIKLKAKSALATIELDARGLKYGAITVDGAPATFTEKFDPVTKTGQVVLKPAKPVAAGKEAVVEIAYTGSVNGMSNEGLFKTVNNDQPDGLPYYFTHFEPAYAQMFFPCNDQPADKATFEFFGVVDSRYSVIASGKKEKDETFEDSGQHLRRVLYTQNEPISPYLFAVAIGVFEPYKVDGDFPAQVFMVPDRKERAYEALNSTRAHLGFLQGFLGVKFPFAKLDQVAVPRYVWSGMENAGLIFNRESKFALETKHDLVGRSRVSGLIAHEMAHQWFGDDVTLAWWDDTWLNEGFATWLGQKAEKAYNDNDATDCASVRYREDYFREEAGPRSHPLQAKTGASAEDLFDDISYTKGAFVLEMLDSWIGKEAMQKSLKAYLEKYQYGNATSDDFFKVVFDTTKKEKELKPFKEAWLKKKAYPVIFPELTYGNDSVNITVRQIGARSDEKGPYVFKLPIVLHRDNEPKYTKEAVILVDKGEVKLKVDVPGPPQWVNWNAGGVALVRVNTPTVPEEQWVDSARLDPDPTWRLQAAMVLLGEMGNLEMKEEARPSDAAFGAIVDVLSKDPSPYVRKELMVRLAQSRFKKLPKELGPVVLGLAKNPKELNEDSIGRTMVRREAMALLGRIDYPEGYKYLYSEVTKSDQDFNFVSGLAQGVARVGTTEAIATLESAIRVQGARGYPYFHAVAEALGDVTNPDGLPPLARMVKEHGDNNELLRNVLGRLGDNTLLRHTPQFAAWTAQVVLDEKGFGEHVRAEMLDLLEDVKLPESKVALTEIVQKSTSERLKQNAQHQLDANFGAAPAAPAPKK